MQRRKYKFDGRTFVGFNKDFSTKHHLVLVQDEDVFDVWAIDVEDISDNIAELLNYFRASQSLSKIVGTYSEEGFRGFTCSNDFVSSLSRFGA